MEFGIGIILSREFDQTTKNNELSNLDTEFKNYFLMNSYGKSILSYEIGITCVSHGFDPFFKAHKPRYTENRTSKMFGLSVVLHNFLDFTIKLDYDIFYPSNTEEGLTYVAKEIMNTVLSIKYPKKVTDFDRVRFEQDLEMFFKEKGLLRKH